MIIRQLAPHETALFRKLRLEALETHPEAYVSTADDLRTLDDAVVSARLAEHPAFVALDRDEPVALMGWLRQPSSKMAHRANLVMVYVRPELRRTGIASALLGHLVVAARQDGIAQLELAVSVENPAAVLFYERFGFNIAGTVPRGFRHQGRDIDEHIMVRDLDA